MGNTSSTSNGINQPHIIPLGLSASSLNENSRVVDPQLVPPAKIQENLHHPSTGCDVSSMGTYSAPSIHITAAKKRVLKHRYDHPAAAAAVGGGTTKTVITTRSNNTSSSSSSSSHPSALVPPPVTPVTPPYVPLTKEGKSKMAQQQRQRRINAERSGGSLSSSGHKTTKVVSVKRGIQKRGRRSFNRTADSRITATNSSSSATRLSSPRSNKPSCSPRDHRRQARSLFYVSVDNHTSPIVPSIMKPEPSVAESTSNRRECLTATSTFDSSSQSAVSSTKSTTTKKTKKKKKRWIPFRTRTKKNKKKNSSSSSSQHNYNNNTIKPVSKISKKLAREIKERREIIENNEIIAEMRRLEIAKREAASAEATSHAMESYPHPSPLLRHLECETNVVVNTPMVTFTSPLDVRFTEENEGLRIYNGEITPASSTGGSLSLASSTRSEDIFNKLLGRESSILSSVDRGRSFRDFNDDQLENEEHEDDEDDEERERRDGLLFDTPAVAAYDGMLPRDDEEDIVTSLHSEKGSIATSSHSEKDSSSSNVNKSIPPTVPASSTANEIPTPTANEIPTPSSRPVEFYSPRSYAPPGSAFGVQLRSATKQQKRELLPTRHTTSAPQSRKQPPEQQQPQLAQQQEPTPPQQAPHTVPRQKTSTRQIRRDDNDDYDDYISPRSAAPKGSAWGVTLKKSSATMTEKTFYLDKAKNTTTTTTSVCGVVAKTPARMDLRDELNQEEGEEEEECDVDDEEIMGDDDVFAAAMTTSEESSPSQEFTESSRNDEDEVVNHDENQRGRNKDHADVIEEWRKMSSSPMKDGSANEDLHELFEETKDNDVIPHTYPPFPAAADTAQQQEQPPPPVVPSSSRPAIPLHIDVPTPRPLLDSGIPRQIALAVTTTTPTPQHQNTIITSSKVINNMTTMTTTTPSPHHLLPYHITPPLSQKTISKQALSNATFLFDTTPTGSAALKKMKEAATQQQTTKCGQGRSSSPSHNRTTTTTTTTVVDESCCDVGSRVTKSTCDTTSTKRYGDDTTCSRRLPPPAATTTPKKAMVWKYSIGGRTKEIVLEKGGIDMSGVKRALAVVEKRRREKLRESGVTIDAEPKRMAFREEIEKSCYRYPQSSSIAKTTTFKHMTMNNERTDKQHTTTTMTTFNKPPLISKTTHPTTTTSAKPPRPTPSQQQPLTTVTATSSLVQRRVTEINGRLKRSAPPPPIKNRRDTGSHDVLAPRRSRLQHPLFKDQASSSSLRDLMAEEEDDDEYEFKKPLTTTTGIVKVRELNMVPTAKVGTGTGTTTATARRATDSPMSPLTMCTNDFVTGGSSSYGGNTNVNDGEAERDELLAAQPPQDTTTNTKEHPTTAMTMATGADNVTMMKESVLTTTPTPQQQQPSAGAAASTTQNMFATPKIKNKKNKKVNTSTPSRRQRTPLGEKSDSHRNSLASQNNVNDNNNSSSDNNNTKTIRAARTNNNSTNKENYYTNNTTVATTTTVSSSNNNIHPRQCDKENILPKTLHLSPIQRTPMQARKWRTMAAQQQQMKDEEDDQQQQGGMMRVKKTKKKKKKQKMRVNVMKDDHHAVSGCDNGGMFVVGV